MESSNSLEAVGELLNNLPNQDNLEQFLERIIKGMIDDMSTQNIFSQKEFAQLGKIFSLSLTDLHNVIDISIYFFEKLAFSKQSVEKARDVLSTAKLNTSICSAFESVWTQYGEAYVAALKKKRVCVPNGLDQVSWTLNIPLENSNILNDTKAIFTKDNKDPEIRLAKDTKAPFVEMEFCTSANQTESVYNTKMDPSAQIEKVTFTKQSLQKFFEELEKIQSKIDA